MKRPRDSSDTSLSRRASSDGDIPGDANDSNTFFVKHQNVALGKEMAKAKNQLSELRVELDRVQKEKRSMESLVAVIDRSWSQLNADVASILASIGHSLATSDSSPATNCTLFSHFIDLGLRYTFADLEMSTSEDMVPKLDNWSGAEETTKEYDRLRDLINSKAFLDPSEELSEVLLAKASFTKTVLKTVCDAISSSNPKLDPRTIIDSKGLQVKQGYLETLLTKIKSEALDLYFKLQQAHREKKTLQRQLEKSVQAQQAMSVQPPSQQPSTPMPEQYTSASSAISENPIAIVIPVPLQSSSSVNSTLVLPVTPLPSADSSALEFKNTILEKQVASSQAEISRLERELSKALAADFLPESSREKYRLDVLSVIQILKDNIDTTVSAQRQKIQELSEVCSAHKNSIESIQSEAKKQIDHSSNLAAVEIKKCQSTVEEVQRELRTAESKLLELDYLKARVQDYAKMVENFETAEKSLQERVTKVISEKEAIEKILLSSKSRETELERRVLLLSGEISVQTKKDIVHGNTEGLFEAGEEFTLEDFARVLDCDNKPENLQRISLIYIAEKRLKDTEKQLETASLNEKDLLMELEAVTTSTAQLKRSISDLKKEREQLQSKLLSSERKVFDLHAEMKESGRKFKMLQEKEDLGCNYRLNQDRLISNLQSKLVTLESELKRVSGVNDELEIKGLYHGTAELESKEKLEALDQELVLSKGNVDRLQKRCEDLTQKYESERKRRLDNDRDQDGPALKRSKSKSGGAVAAGGEDSALLDISLNMLRCSVCKDRFKEVAITRCFHLFCKECIESNIANRNRKCPMCGEKFGQDDVKKVHFTN